MTTCCCFRMCPSLKTSLQAALSYCHLKKPVVKYCTLMNCSFSLRCFETAQTTSGFFFLVLLLESHVLEEESCVINSSKEKSHGKEMTSLTAIRKKFMSPTNHQSKFTDFHAQRILKMVTVYSTATLGDPELATLRFLSFRNFVK